MMTLLIAYNVVCHLWPDDIKINLGEAQRELIRTILYVIAIILFPLTNLMRHVLLRLNQTMPGAKAAERRYFMTVIVTQGMIEPVGLFGLLMFILGDDFNTLYIFTVLGALGIYLHRPKWVELQSIEYALTEMNDQGF
ncbi:MAG: hypothetical protein PHH11_00650 [Methylomonas sp.]|nr:hypothetical protein [Methylomonas sp.]